MLLDLDGTLTNPAEGIVRCLEHALGSMGVIPDARVDLTEFIGPPLQDSFRHLLKTESAEVVDEAIRHYRDRFADVGLFENEVYDGIPEALEELASAGFELRVATSKPHVFAERILEHFDLGGFFPAVYGSELSGVRSDKAELIAYLLDQESLAADYACMVGDRSHDVRGALRNGVCAVGVLWGFGSRKELTEAGANSVAVAVPDLVSTVRHLTGR